MKNTFGYVNVVNIEINLIETDSASTLRICYCAIFKPIGISDTYA